MGIPDTAVEAAARSLHPAWDYLSDVARENITGDLREALEAAAPFIAAQAWQEGFKQGGPMHDVNYDDPDAHRRNPYADPQ